MAAEKKRILDYLEEQLNIKIEALQRYEMPIQDLKDKSPSEIEAFQLRHDIYELKRHIAVIKML
jgi:FtsZ-binding cell division protein ZapB